MASPRLSTAEPAIHSSLRFLQDALADFHPHDFAVRLALLVKPNHGDSGLPLTRADWYA